jgi:hypothetical protein
LPDGFLANNWLEKQNSCQNIRKTGNDLQRSSLGDSKMAVGIIIKSKPPQKTKPLPLRMDLTSIIFSALFWGLRNVVILIFCVTK